MIENEFKLMLTEAQYKAVLEMYPRDEEIVQTNYYYDTAELSLSAEHITCRVREIAGEYFLQIKLPAGREYSRVELSEKLEGLPDDIAGSRLDKLAGEYRSDFPNVSKLGSLTTKRSVKHFPGGEIDIDESRYFGKTDYEIEIEFTDEKAARKLLEDVRNLIGETTSESEVCTGKIHRFLDEFRRQK